MIYRAEDWSWHVPGSSNIYVGYIGPRIDGGT